ncbi:Cof-type HAD-IIB family hydrolase [Latilactobacillus graminis]|uniref:Cof-like hydrolase family protein n=2 Tax=Latilactobacillus graminis TaxID=60519 RepID=A0AA89I035_9LACO|nr:Cof-type HAD-IIB family hydrolase [Latilactobacillus graminis]KRM21092.1 cof-like hydrolase family protein [Latilactobacillus graminis DSM 20719]QFP79220.1 Cof-type HAD-IIB family hydrolase [Latilactobacillus graminis]
MTVKLIASDMDHTLLTENGQLPPNFVPTIRQLYRRGILFAAASGRPMYTLRQMFPELANMMIYVSDNGATIAYQGQTLFKSLLPLVDYQRMIEFVNQIPGGIGVICGMDAAYVETQYQNYDAILRQFYTNIKYVPDLTQVRVEANKFTIYFPGKDSQKQYDAIFAPQFAADFSVTVAGVEWIDIMNQGINKGHAMNLLADHLHITPAAMMAFGDTYNDKEMLQTVKYSYLMGNASDEMAEYANYRADTNENYGVLKEIQKLL